MHNSASSVEDVADHDINARADAMLTCEHPMFAARILMMLDAIGQFVDTGIQNFREGRGSAVLVELIHARESINDLKELVADNLDETDNDAPEAMVNC